MLMEVEILTGYAVLFLNIKAIYSTYQLSSAVYRLQLSQTQSAPGPRRPQWLQ